MTTASALRISPELDGSTTIRPFHALSLVVACVTACAPAPAATSPADRAVSERFTLAPSAAPGLRNAKIEPTGYATILDAPPVPYPAEVPPDPDPPARADVRRREALMNPDEATTQAAFRLRDRLVREAADTYVDLMVIRDPKPRFAVYFRRNAVETLARFTTNPRFKAVEGGLPERELQPLMEEWSGRFAAKGWGWHGSANTFEGRAEMNLGVPRSEFERVARAEGWPATPPRLRLAFAKDVDDAAAVAPEVRPYVRVFARAAQSPGIVLTVAIHGRVVLRDGCFRVDDGNGGGPLALFGRETVLRRDADGYLVAAGLGAPNSGARIGERMVWGGYPEGREDEAGVRALRQHCGDGPIASVGVPESLSSFRVRPWAITAYAGVKGLSRQAAWEEIKACWAAAETRPEPLPGEPSPLPRECDSPYGPTPPRPQQR